jgi:hypothetical protein
VGLSVWLQLTNPPKARTATTPDPVAVGGDAEAEVARPLALGATHADVGQTGVAGPVVLSDLEGNEFCVLHRR